MLLNHCTDSANTVLTVTVIIVIGISLLLYFLKTLHYITFSLCLVDVLQKHYVYSTVFFLQKQSSQEYCGSGPGIVYNRCSKLTLQE
jgi:hypothetical protein